ncbi:MAG: hypothetical protein ACFFKA_05830 [Candidatus Thorarchaeota archaeon]
MGFKEKLKDKFKEKYGIDVEVAAQNLLKAAQMQKEAIEKQKALDRERWKNK